MAEGYALRRSGTATPARAAATICVGRREFIKLKDTDAGWSSSVARWAHNPEVAGSNPAPATNFRSSRPFPIRERAFGVTGHVTRYVTKREPVLRAEARQVRQADTR